MKKTEGSNQMMLKNTLMGTGYEYLAIDPVKPVEPVRRAVNPVDAAMAMEEQRITEMRRAEYRAFAPILSPTDAAVQAATFRGRFEPSRVSEAERRARAERAQQADFPVSPRVAPLVMSPEIERMERRSIRADYGSLVPVQRKSA